MAAALLLIAIIVLGWWAARGRHRWAWPGLVSASLLWVVATFGAQLWNTSRLYHGAGVPSKLIADSSLDSSGAQALLWASVGSLAGVVVTAAVLSSLRFRRRAPALLTDAAEPVVDASAKRRPTDLVRLDWLTALSGVLLVAWALGQGPSVWLRDKYLAADGIGFLLTATTTPAPLIAATTLSASLIARARGATLVRAGAIGAAWWLCTLAVGTRLAVAFPLAVLAAVIVRLARRRPLTWRIMAGCAALTYATVYVVILSFSVTLLVRGVPHGILRLPELLAHDGHPSLWFLSWAPMVMRMVASVSASYIVTQYSVLHPPPAEILWVNANPLPGAIAGVDAFTYERMADAQWVPLAMAGEWYGVYGPVGQVALFAVNAIAGAWSTRYFSAKRRGFLAALAFVLTVFVAAISVQYPSRWFWRMLSIAVALPVFYAIAVWALPLIRVRYARHLFHIRQGLRARHPGPLVGRFVARAARRHQR